MPTATEIVDIVKAFFAAFISVFEQLKGLFSAFNTGDDETTTA